VQQLRAAHFGDVQKFGADVLQVAVEVGAELLELQCFGQVLEVEQQEEQCVEHVDLLALVVVRLVVLEVAHRHVQVGLLPLRVGVLEDLVVERKPVLGLGVAHVAELLAHQAP
jgi:hypothetical protein